MVQLLLCLVRVERGSDSVPSTKHFVEHQIHDRQNTVKVNHFWSENETSSFTGNSNDLFIYTQRRDYFIFPILLSPNFALCAFPSHCLSSLCVYFLFLVECHIAQKKQRKNKVQNVMRLHQHKVKSFSVMSF